MTTITTAEQRIAQLEADIRILEDAVDAGIEDRKRISADLDVLTDVLLGLVKKLSAGYTKSQMRGPVRAR